MARHRQLWLLIAAAGCAVAAAFVYVAVTFSSRLQAVDAAAARKILATLSTLGEQKSFDELWPLLRKG